MKKFILTDDDYDELIYNIQFMRQINRAWAQNDMLTSEQRQRCADRYMALGKLLHLFDNQE